MLKPLVAAGNLLFLAVICTASSLIPNQSGFIDATVRFPLNEAPVIVASKWYELDDGSFTQMCEFLTWDRSHDQLARFAHLDYCADYQNLVWMVGGTRFLYADGNIGSLSVRLFDGKTIETI